MKVNLDNFHIAGFGFWDGCEAFEHLKIGTRLDLAREADNPFDPYAVAIYYGEYKLGFIPRGSNHDISKYLDMGLGDIYEVRITRITPDVPPEQQVEVVLYVKSQK
jgi:HIRAN domain.